MRGRETIERGGARVEGGRGEMIEREGGKVGGREAGEKVGGGRGRETILRGRR